MPKEGLDFYETNANNKYISSITVGEYMRENMKNYSTAILLLFFYYLSIKTDSVYFPEVKKRTKCK